MIVDVRCSSDNGLSAMVALCPFSAMSDISRCGKGLLFDNLIGERQQRRGYDDAERLCSFLIDHQSEFARLLDR
jgi:hypothetical protein